MAKLTADWPVSRLIDIWNSFAGVAPFTELKPVKKFTDRKAAITRIWKAVERLARDVAQPAADVAPVKGTAKKSPSKRKQRHTARPGAKKSAAGAREGSKKGEVIDLMRRPSGGHPCRGHRTDRMAAAHGARLRERNSGQENAPSRRILPHRREGAVVQDQVVGRSSRHRPEAARNHPGGFFRCHSLESRATLI